MPALPSVPGVLKFQFQHLMNNVPAFVHWYCGYSGSGPLSSDCNALGNSAKGAWVTNFAPLVPANTQLSLVQVTDLGSPTGGQGTSSGSSPGSRAGTLLTANDCAMFNLKIGRRYRGGKPRQYWPFGVAGDLLDQQHWTTAFQTSCGSAWNAVNTALLALTWTGGNITRTVNVSYYQGFTVVTNPSTGRARNQPKLRSTPLIDTVTSATISARIATQRRREHFSA